MATIELPEWVVKRMLSEFARVCGVHPDTLRHGEMPIRAAGAELLAIIEERAGPGVSFMLPDGRFLTLAELLED